MLTAPPIEGNSDYRARSFHLELYFDQEAIRQQLIFYRVALNFYRSMTTRGISSPTTIHFTIDRRHGILKAGHIARLYKFLRARGSIFFRQWSPCGATLQPLSLIAFGTEAMSYFGRFIPYIRGLLLWPTPLDHERSTLYKWNRLAGYYAPPGAPPMVAPPMSPQLFLLLASTPTIPPVGPFTSEPSITISASEFRALVHTFQTLTTTHAALFQQMAEMRAHQDQQTAILRQIQHLRLLPHLSLTIPYHRASKVRIPPPQEATTATPEDASSPPEAPTT
ncbi:hypothetical protein AAG906_035451 [Vitis piasezkii]